MFQPPDGPVDGALHDREPGRAAPTWRTWPGERPETSAVPSVGEVLGERYQLERLLGRGGFGLVFQGRELGSGAQVAVKVVRDQGEARTRLLREIGLLRRLDMPGVVGFRGRGEHRGAPYMVMDRVKGERFCGGRPWTMDEVQPPLVRLLEVLRGLHERAVVHLDLKPANVLLSPGGRPVVLDFGSARTPGRRLGGRVAGTMPYLAPEAVQGGPVDGRADLYSLAMMVMRALMGVGVGGQAPDMRGAARSLVEGRLGELLEAMLERDPQQRPGCAGEALAALVA